MKTVTWSTSDQGGRWNQRPFSQWDCALCSTRATMAQSAWPWGRAFWGQSWLVPISSTGSGSEGDSGLLQGQGRWGTNPSLPSPPRRRSGDRCCPVRRARDCIQRGTERYDADKALPSRHGRAGAAARLNRSAALAPPRGPTRAARGGARSEDLTPSRSSHRSLGFVAGL